MKTAIVSVFNTSTIKRVLKKNGFTVVKNNPDIVISYGGDGTILYSERLYPSVPKLTIKTTEICRKCDYTEIGLGAVLKQIKKGNYKIREQMKLEATYKRNKLTALNEIQVRNKYPTRGMRFSLSFNGKKTGKIIADGVIISTPFGSSGYYHAVGGKAFKKGIGICINNPTTNMKKNWVIPERGKVVISLDRDTSYLVEDNNEKKLIELKKGDRIIIERSRHKARFIEIGR